MHIIVDGVLMLSAKHYHYQIILVETTASQSWRVLLRHSVVTQDRTTLLILILN